MVVVDSVAALVPKQELEGDMGDVAPGAQARLMSQALRKLTGAIHKSDTIVLFINQTRMKIGVMFGSPVTTSGGNALKFYASVRLEITRIGALKAGTEVIGNRTRCKVVKNKLAPPFRQCEFEIRYGTGSDQASELIDLGIEEGIIQKSGSWFSIAGERMGQGKENSRAYLLERPKVMDEIRNAILRKHGLLPEETAPQKSAKKSNGAGKAMAAPPN